MKAQNSFKFLILLSIIQGISIGQLCQSVSNQETCQNKADCEWTVNTNQNKCVDQDLQCSSLTGSQCTDVCKLINSKGTCTQIKNLGCTSLASDQCNQNTKCVIDNTQKCVDRDYKCNMNDRNTCLSQQGICFWQEEAAGECVNAISCSGKTQSNCNTYSSNCQWNIGGICTDKNVVINVSTSQYVIKFAMMIFASIIVITF